MCFVASKVLPVSKGLSNYKKGKVFGLILSCNSCSFIFN